MTQVINWSGDSGDGVCIGGRDPTTLITPNRAMSFKFRSSFRTVTTTQKAPAFKNTASAERFIDHTNAADILANHSVKKHLAEVNFEDHGHSVLKESGVTRGHSVLQNSFSEKLSGRDSIMGGAGKQNESQFGEDGVRSAGKFGKGMAGNDDKYGGRSVEDAFSANAYATLAHNRLVRECKANPEACNPNAIDQMECLAKESANQLDEANGREVKPLPPKCTGEDNSTPTNPSSRPGPDDNGGSEGGFMTWKLQDQLSNGIKNAKDPIINPFNENQGGGVLTATELKEMEDGLRNAKDPATNWGDDTYNNFMGAIEMNIGEISLKNPATNWGDNYTSTMANICDCVLTVQDF